MNNHMNKKPLFDRRGKSGIYSVVLSLILLAVLVVVNMIVGSLPAKFTMLDTTASGQYEISGTTENFISGIDENATYKVNVIRKLTDAPESFTAKGDLLVNGGVYLGDLYDMKTLNENSNSIASVLITMERINA